jgi:hypothetical protein
MEYWQRIHLFWLEDVSCVILLCHPISCVLMGILAEITDSLFSCDPVSPFCHFSKHLVPVNENPQISTCCSLHDNLEADWSSHLKNT